MASTSTRLVADPPAERMRRSRAALAARGGRLLQVKLSADALRALAAAELEGGAASPSEAVTAALEEFAARRRFPQRLTRDEELALAALAAGPFTAQAFRATGHADSFLAGIAVALATDRRLPRQRLLALARELCAAVATQQGYDRWLRASPIRLARLFKLVDVELGVARSNKHDEAA